MPKLTLARAEEPGDAASYGAAPVKLRLVFDGALVPTGTLASRLASLRCLIADAASVCTPYAFGRTLYT